MRHIDRRQEIEALPLSIALGIASGVSPEQGLYTAIVAGFLIAFLGGSRVQISGPTAAFATIVAGIVATDGIEGLVAATIIAGILLIFMGLFKLGALIRFVPFTITTGFTAGIAGEAGRPRGQLVHGERAGVPGGRRLPGGAVPLAARDRARAQLAYGPARGHRAGERARP